MLKIEFVKRLGNVDDIARQNAWLVFTRAILENVGVPIEKSNEIRRFFVVYPFIIGYTVD